MREMKERVNGRTRRRIDGAQLPAPSHEGAREGREVPDNGHGVSNSNVDGVLG